MLELDFLNVGCIILISYKKGWAVMRRIILTAVFLFVALGVKMGFAQSGQFFDPDKRILCWNCSGHREHFLLTGVGGDIAFRVLPFINPSWRSDPIKRVELVMIVGGFLELMDYAWCRREGNCGRIDTGFGIVDIFYNAGGAVATELVFYGARRALGSGAKNARFGFTSRSIFISISLPR